MLEVEDDWSPLLQTLEGDPGWLRAVTFSPNGQILASASIDRTVRLWDTKTGMAPGTLEGRSAIFPDGQIFASASDDRTVRLWDAKTGIIAVVEIWGEEYRPKGSTQIYTAPSVTLQTNV